MNAAKTSAAEPGAPAPSRPIRVAMVEDVPALRQSVAELVGEASDLRWIAGFSDGETALRELPTAAPDVVLMDIRLPGMSGVECVRELKDRLPGTQFMMLTVFEESDLIFRSLRAGATAYLLKESLATELVAAIRELHAGGSPMSPSIARKVVQTFRGGAKVGARTAFEPLSDRERQVLDLLARGRQYKEVANELGLSYHTVRTHVQHIYRKLHVGSKAEAVEVVR